MVREKRRKSRWIGQGRWPLLIALMSLPLGGWWAYVSVADTDFPGLGERLESPATTEELSRVAFAEIERQLRDGTIGRFISERTSWSSQPGAIRVFSSRDSTGDIYKLYSASDMQVDGATDLGLDVPADWDQQPDQFVDLNAPSISSGGKLIFPIADPRAFAGAGNSESAEGFSYSADINGVVAPDPITGSNDSQRLPMPVKWRYVLRNGEVGALDAQNRWVGYVTPNVNNPIVGRVAYWTDDLSCRVNVNTASEGVYWDTPRADTIEERAYATNQPARDEFQRQSGHPAQVCLSSVLFPNRRYYLPGTEGELNALSLAEAEQLWSITPGVGTGGSKGGTRRIAEDEAPVPAVPADYRLYDSLEEVVASNPALPVEVSQRLAQAEFLLTTESNAPETSLRGVPRVSMWPVAEGEDARSTFDQKMVSACTLGEEKYFVQRSNSRDLHRDLYLTALGNNAYVDRFLRPDDGSLVPGYNQQSFQDKYGNGLYEDWAQIGLATLGYIRACNLFDPTAPVSFTPSGSKPGCGQVSVMCKCGGSFSHQTSWYNQFSPYPLSGGRSFDVSEVALVFVISGYVDLDGSAYGDTEENRSLRSRALLPGEKRFEVGLVIEMFCPQSGVRQIRPLSGVRIANDVSGGEIITSEVLLSIDSEEYLLMQSPFGELFGEASSDPDQGGSGGVGIYSGYPRGAAFAWSRRGSHSDPFGNRDFLVTGDTMTIEGLGYQGTFGFNSGFDIISYSDTIQTTSGIRKRIHIDPLRNVDQVEIPSPQLPQDLSTIGTWEERLAAAESDPKSLIREGDVVRSTVLRFADSRMVSPRLNVYSWYGDLDFIPHTDFFDSSKMMSHSLTDRHGQALYGATFQRSLVVGADYAPEIKPDFSADPASDDYVISGPGDATEPAPDPSVTGDFDTGFARTPDGAYNNHPDPGVYFTDGIPYFDQADDTSNTNATVFSPQRIMSGPGMFGSLPTGVQTRTPWLTLLFRPDPQHFGSTGVPDHILLDSFWMPVLEPRAISHDFSTDGKINLNYEIAPFSHIRRATAMHALLKAEKMMAIPVSAAPFYKTQTSDVKWRHFIDAEETLQQFDERFAGGDFFRSASEICEQYLVPEGEQLGLKVDGDYPDMRAFWETHRLTGDNVKERPYTNLHTRLTTKSNSFKIYAIVQPITKAPGSDQAVFDSANDTLGEAKPVSATLKRLLDGTPDCFAFDQDSRDIPNYLDASFSRLPVIDNYYRYSIVDASPDLREPVKLEEVTHDATGEVSIRWRARGADLFVVERSIDLKEWEVIDPNFGGTAPWTEFVDPSPPEGVRAYYRVSRQ